MRWLNEGICHKISKSEWDEFITVIQDKFLLLRWRRNLTRSFCQWMQKKTLVHYKQQTLVSLEDGRYRWKQLGKEKYQWERLALFPNSWDVEAARDCIERACGCS